MKLWERNPHEVTDTEGECLHQLAREVPEGFCIVEVGSYRGRSTCFLAAGSDAGARVPVYAVDLWTDAPTLQMNRRKKLKPRPYNLSESREAFDDAMELHGRGLVTAIQGASVEVAQTFEHRVGLLFLDGSHAYADVRDDLLHWAPLIPIGGRIALHDWDFKAVRKATRRTLKPHWVKVERAERICVVQRVS